MNFRNDDALKGFIIDWFINNEHIAKLKMREEDPIVTKARELVESQACIIDVREQNEFDLGHLKTAVNIPLSELRQRIDEIPRKQPVYMHCKLHLAFYC